MGHSLHLWSLDQRTWMKVKRVRYEGNLADFLGLWFPAGGIPDRGVALPH